jgi:hypothetical protein
VTGAGSEGKNAYKSTDERATDEVPTVRIWASPREQRVNAATREVAGIQAMVLRLTDPREGIAVFRTPFLHGKWPNGRRVSGE